MTINDGLQAYYCPSRGSASITGVEDLTGQAAPLLPIGANPEIMALAGFGGSAAFSNSSTANGNGWETAFECDPNLGALSFWAYRRGTGQGGIDNVVNFGQVNSRDQGAMRIESLSTDQTTANIGLWLDNANTDGIVVDATINRWNHLTIEWDYSIETYWITENGGARQQQGPLTLSQLWAAHPLRFNTGRSNNYDAWYAFDGVRAWNRLLTQQERDDLYAGGRAYVFPAPKVHPLSGFNHPLGRPGNV